MFFSRLRGFQPCQQALRPQMSVDPDLPDPQQALRGAEYPVKAGRVHTGRPRLAMTEARRVVLFLL